MDRLRGILDGLRSYWENLNARERMLLGLLGAVAAALLVFLPVYLLGTSISDLEEDNQKISDALRQIARSRGRIAAMRAEEEARDLRYDQGAPPEQWLPSQVEDQGLSFSRVQQEPDRTEGRFRIHTTRASFQGAGLRASMLLLQDLKNSRYPVAIERIHIDHHSAGDQYNLEVGVLTYERQGGTHRDAGTPPARPTAGGRNAAGPPSP